MQSFALRDNPDGGPSCYLHVLGTTQHIQKNIFQHPQSMQISSLAAKQPPLAPPDLPCCQAKIILFQVKTNQFHKIFMQDVIKFPVSSLSCSIKILINAVYTPDVLLCRLVTFLAKPIPGLTHVTNDASWFRFS
mmetsp:Transcript_43005/g.77263  ORF Transcript_43005/g.77263 Transcript_43005/m.77263 type:complete len:134 (-) Transcript_43005:322-723(-)